VRSRSDHKQLLASLPIGVPVTGRGRTVSAGELALLAAVSGWSTSDEVTSTLVDCDDDRPLEPHLALAVVLSLAAASPLFARLEAEHGLVTVAALQHRGKLGDPIRPGDTIVTSSEIQAMRASSSKPDHYVMTLRDTGTNQHGREVMEINRILLVRHRHTAEPGQEVRP
jgi:hypothetical protein